MFLQLALSRAERIRQSDIHVFVPLVARGVPRYFDLQPRHSQLDADVKQVAALTVMMRYFDDYRAAQSAVEALLEATDRALNSLLD